MTPTRSPDRWRYVPWAIAALILLGNAVASRVSDQVNWGPEDFVAAGLLLALGCTAWEIARRVTPRPRRRLILGLAIVVAVLYVWAELAVGIFTNLGS